MATCDFKHARRSANFSSFEESVLADLIGRYTRLIENKSSDTNSNRIKGKTWKMIEIEFSTRCKEFYRSAGILKTKYENLKKRSRNLFVKGAEEQREVLVMNTDPIPHNQIFTNTNTNQKTEWDEIQIEQDTTIIKEEKDEGLYQTSPTYIDDSEYKLNMGPDSERLNEYQIIDEPDITQDDNIEIDKLKRQTILQEHELKMTRLKQIYDLKLEQEVERLRHLKRIHYLQQQGEKLKLRLIKKNIL